MLEFLKCNLCGSQDYKVLYKSNLDTDSFDVANYYACTNAHLGRHGQIVRCNHCGLVYTNPRFPYKEMLSRYRGVIDNIYLKEKAARVLTFANSLKEIESIKQKGKILDVGCYTGFFLEVARNKDWDTYGIEPSIWASQYAREILGLNVKTANMEEEYDFSNNYFDVITFWDTLEHLADPKSALQKAHRLLKDDGLLCITTINIDTLFARILGSRWPQLMQMHTYYFSSHTLGRLLEKCGFTIIREHKHKRVLRLDYLIGRIENYFRFVSYALYGITRALKLGDLSVSVNAGDLITIYANKIKQ